MVVVKRRTWLECRSPGRWYERPFSCKQQQRGGEWVSELYTSVAHERKVPELGSPYHGASKTQLSGGWVREKLFYANAYLEHDAELVTLCTHGTSTGQPWPEPQDCATRALRRTW